VLLLIWYSVSVWTAIVYGVFQAVFCEKKWSKYNFEYVEKFQIFVERQKECFIDLTVYGALQIWLVAITWKNLKYAPCCKFVSGL